MFAERRLPHNDGVLETRGPVHVCAALKRKRAIAIKKIFKKRGKSKINK